MTTGTKKSRCHLVAVVFLSGSHLFAPIVDIGPPHAPQHRAVLAAGLQDGLNKVGGRNRAWLPPPDEPVCEAFWVQYDRAEKFDKELQQEAQRVARAAGFHGSYDHPIRQCMRNDSDASKRGEEMLVAAIDTVLERHGLLQALEDGTRAAAQQLLLAA